MQTGIVLGKDGCNLNDRSAMTCKYSVGISFLDQIPKERIIDTVLSGEH